MGFRVFGRNCEVGARSDGTVFSSAEFSKCKWDRYMLTTSFFNLGVDCEEFLGFLGFCFESLG